MSFPLILAWLLVTIWVGQLFHGVHICQLSGVARHK
jgi:hypothetical protein